MMNVLPALAATLATCSSNQIYLVELADYRVIVFGFELLLS
jgi:hypothetical protein